MHVDPLCVSGVLEAYFRRRCVNRGSFEQTDGGAEHQRVERCTYGMIYLSRDGMVTWSGAVNTTCNESERSSLRMFGSWELYHTENHLKP